MRLVWWSKQFKLTTQNETLFDLKTNLKADSVTLDKFNVLESFQIDSNAENWKSMNNFEVSLKLFFE